MRIEYNSPVILTFVIACSAILALNPLFNWVPYLFTVRPDMEMSDPLSWIRLFGHALGHANWDHLLGNMTMILLVGPIIEEKYGSYRLLSMLFFTGLITGILQMMFFDTGLLGASGIVFMLIILGSLTNFRSGHIPLTFILVVVLFLGREIVNSFKADSISQSAHIIGGIVGAVFGFTMRRRTPARHY